MPLFLFLSSKAPVRHDWLSLEQRPQPRQAGRGRDWVGSALSVPPSRRKKIKYGGTLGDSVADFTQLFLTHSSFFKDDFAPILLRMIKFIIDFVRKFVR